MKIAENQCKLNAMVLASIAEVQPDLSKISAN